MNIQLITNCHCNTWKAAAVVSTIAIALSTIAVTSLMLTTGVNAYVYGTSAVGIASLMMTAISCCKMQQTTKKTVCTVKLKESLPLDMGESFDTYEVTIKNFDPEAFKSWVLERNPSANKKALLEATVLEAIKDYNPGQTMTLTYHQIIPPEKGFDSLLQAPMKSSCEFETTDQWYDYQDRDTTYIDFANAVHFGGGWRSRGNVQEETMFFEFVQLALLAFATKDNPIHPVVGGKAPKGDPSDRPTPFIIPNLIRNFRVDLSLYGRALENTRSHPISAYVTKASSNRVTITGIAARDWSKNKRSAYTRQDFVYHLQAAYLTFVGQKKANQKHVVHTAPWGCGAFKNSEWMMIAIQILAARMAGVKIVFHGVGNLANPGYTNENISYISQLIDRSYSPGSAMTDLLSYQQSLNAGKKWRPKQ